MSIRNRSSLRKIILLAFLLSACATTAPVQEMSDARQAIYAAKQVVSQTSPSHQNVQRAELLLQAAQAQLRAGDYAEARRSAEIAKYLAIEAREAEIGDRANN